VTQKGRKNNGDADCKRSETERDCLWASVGGGGGVRVSLTSSRFDSESGVKKETELRTENKKRQPFTQRKKVTRIHM